MLRTLLLLGLLVLLQPGVSAAGPYSPAGGQPGSTAIPAADPSIVEWATGYTIDRGLVEIDNPSLGYATYGGPRCEHRPHRRAAATAINLLRHRPGPGRNDHAHFRQGDHQRPGTGLRRFRQRFLVRQPEWAKLAFVEVSSDGVNFFRFPSVSLTQTTTQVGSYGQLDPTNLYDLAGKDPAG